MPMPALVALLVMLSGVFASHAMAACSSNAGTALASSVAGVVLALDDETYSDRYDQDDESAVPEDRDFNYFERDEEDDGGNSAHAPDDDDDGWDIDPLNRSEWA
jgi:hypothetical protein